MSAPSMTSVEVDAAAPAAAHPRINTPEQWVAAFDEGWRARRGPDAFVAHFRGLLADDIRLIQPALPAIDGFAAFERSFVRPLFALLPDLSGEVERWGAHEDTLYIELTLRGTLGGRALVWRACDRIALRDGLAVERESYYDPTPLLAALARTPRSWRRFARLRAPWPSRSPKARWAR